MEALQILSRNEMKMIKGGGGETGCRVYITYPDGSGTYSDGCYDFATADAQHEQINPDGSVNTGYCCASYGSGDFSNATPCTL